MSQRTGIATGETLGTWRVTGAGVRVGELTRAPVEDPSGRQAEAWVAGAAVPAERRAAMADHQGRQVHLDGPAHVDVLDVFVDADRVVVVRTPTLGTLEGIALPLPSGDVAAIGVHLFQAVREAAPQLALALQPDAIAIDPVGHVALGPLGLPPATVPREAIAYTAPEAFRADAAAPTPDAALYGLGANLYRLATGQAPTGGARSDRPPPVPAGHLRHGLDPDLDRALQLLLSTDPSERAGALPLLQRAAGPLPDLRPSALPSRVGDVVYTTSSDATVAARPDDAVGGFVLVAADDWSTLSPAVRSHAAGVAGVALAAAEAAAEEGLPIVLATTRGGHAASERASELSAHLGAPVQAVAGGGVPGWVPAGLAAALALLPGGVGAGTLLVGWWPVALMLFVVAAVVVAMGAVAGLAVGRRRSRRRLAQAGHDHLQAHRRARAAHGRLGHVWDRAARLRVALAEQSHLPEPAEIDLRADLRDLEHRLLETATQAEAAGRALGQVDAAGLRTRIAALDLRAGHDPAAREERDRLRRTLADLEAVSAQRDAVLAEARAIDAQLDAIAAAVARSGAGADEGLDTLARDAVARREAERRAMAAARERS